MQHFNEEQIDRFLNSNERELADLIGLRQHLDECQGCREIYDELSRFYSTMNLKDQRILAPKSNIKSELIVFPNDRTTPFEYSNRGLISQSWQFVQRHPFASRISTVTVLGIAVAMISIISTEDVSHPQYAIANDSTSQLEVFGENGNLLWTVPYERSLPIGSWESENKAKLTTLVTLNSIEAPRVVTMIPQLGDFNNMGMIRCFDSEGQLMWGWSYGGNKGFRYGNLEYPLSLQPHSIVPWRNGLNGKYEIIAALNNAHSPSAMVRLDPQGTFLGALWSYGHITGLELYDVNNDGTLEILTMGIDDEVNSSYVSVVDPSTITEERSSLRSPGFQLSTSMSELKIISLPEPPWSKLFFDRPSFFAVTSKTRDDISFAWGHSGKSPWYLNFVFDSRLNLKSVLSTDSWKQKKREDAFFNRLSDGQIRKWVLENIKFREDENWKKKASSVKSE